MALQIFQLSSVGTGVRVDLDGGDADAFIGRSAVIGSQNDIAIRGTGSNHKLNVQGVVVAAGSAIQLGDSPVDSGEFLLIGTDGQATTMGTAAAVVVNGEGASIDNRGTIWGANRGLMAGGDVGPATSIVNSGVIEGGSNGIYRINGTTGTIELDNRGEIRGLVNSYYGFSGFAAQDLITNSGLMDGNVFLAGGADTYDGRLGRVIGGVDGGDGIDQLLGGSFADDLDGDAGDDVLAGGGGDDLLYGDLHNDVLTGGAGNDQLDGGPGADTMSGGAGNDIYHVGDAGDVAIETGGSGVDRIDASISFSLSNAAKAKGAFEHLTLVGNTAANGTGNALANVITGNGFANILDGLAGNDRLVGGGGTDTLRGGPGNDVLTGGAAKDFFVFNTTPNAALNRDAIVDFVHGLDKFQFENAIFAKLGGPGVLNPAFFRLGAAAADANDFVVYNKATGVLVYDSNANAAGGAVQVAVLTGKPALTNADFLVI